MLTKNDGSGGDPLTGQGSLWIFCLEKSLKMSKFYVFCQCTYARQGRIIGSTSENDTTTVWFPFLPVQLNIYRWYRTPLNPP